MHWFSDHWIESSIITFENSMCAHYKPRWNHSPKFKQYLEILFGTKINWTIFIRKFIFQKKTCLHTYYRYKQTSWTLSLKKIWKEKSSNKYYFVKLFLFKLKEWFHFDEFATVACLKELHQTSYSTCWRHLPPYTLFLVKLAYLNHYPKYYWH